MENNFSLDDLKVLGGADIASFTNMLEEIISIPDAALNKESIEIFSGMIKGAFTDKVKADGVQGLIKEFENANMSTSAAEEQVEIARTVLNAAVEGLELSAAKQQMVDTILNEMIGIFNMALEQYHHYDIILPIKLDEGAQVPTYAHEGDAAADLYAADDVVIPAHSTSNMVRTGVHIALPERWMAFIFPRSSIGAKTGLRLSNSAGIIDSNYRGPLGVLYDNISDSDYEIKAGDRIAQLLIMPSHRFQASVVDILPATDRNEEGFGSTGK